MPGEIPNKDGILRPGQMSNQGGSLLEGQIENPVANLLTGQMQNRGSGILNGQAPNMLQQQEMSRNYQMSRQLRNSVVSHQSLGPESLKDRKFILMKIYEFLMKRQQHTPVSPQSRILELAIKVEEALFKYFTSQDEYLNLATLEKRLQLLARWALRDIHNQQYSHVKSPSFIGTMFPTPGTSQSRNSSLISASAVDYSMGLSNNINCGASGISNYETTIGSPACGIGGSFSQCEGDGYAMPPAHVSGSGDLYAPVTSMSSLTTNRDSNALTSPVISKRSSPSLANHSEFNIPQHATKLNPRSVDQLEKSSFPSQSSFFGNQQNGQNQHHHIFLDDNAFGLSQLPSNLGGQVKSEAGSDSYTQAMRYQVPEQLQVSNMPSQASQNALNFNSRNSQWKSLPSGPQISTSTLYQTSQQIPQMLHLDQFLAKIQSDLIYPSRSVQADESYAPVNFSSEPDVQQNNSHRMTGLDKSRNFSAQRQLLLLSHAQRCPSPEGKCPRLDCIFVQKLLLHMKQCRVFKCPYLQCRNTRNLINHYQQCKNMGCPVCVPVKNYFGTHPTEVDAGSSLDTSPLADENAMNLEPSLKRVKIEHLLQPDVLKTETNVEPNSTVSENHVLQDPVENQSNTGVLSKPHNTDIKMEFTSSGGQSKKSNELNSENLDGSWMQRPNIEPCMPKSAVFFSQQESLKLEKEMSEIKLESMSVPLENASGSKSGKSKVKGVSLIELFTPEQVHEHIQGLRKWIGHSKSKLETNQAMLASTSENSCQLCAVEKLTFQPPPIYCSMCGCRIKRNAMYYTIGADDTRHWFCIHCHNEARGKTIKVEKTSIPKARLEKKKNDEEETEEWWVQCDKCEVWQHQICALFNSRRNEGGQAEYICPYCYRLEVERGERMPLQQSAVLGAKDLPRTILSDHIENRLAGKLKQERQDRADHLEKSFDEIPGADGIVVRVVSSVDKKLEVKPQFLEIFKEENYTSEFPYKSKVLLLFQNIEGVEVCLFGMYVQEFGSECKKPNNRRVYLSYLDSVKYFRPEIKTISGESLRTYVYHEILIGYLEYCKMRGFSSCYIWASPPLKGDDYIFYCHPEIQKTPKSDKLREWYLSMLRKAARENIVAELTNVYDHFFMTTGECRAKVTAARLPYFDGDYWPGAAEDMISRLQEEEERGKQHKKGILRKSITKTALKAAGQTDLSGNASKDLLLMHKLGKINYAMREDFIMAHLQHSCTHCCILMVSGNRWTCNSCKTFNLCDKCYKAERKREDRERHPINKKFKHPLYSVEIKDVAYDTKDKDEIVESEFFDTRHAYSSLCQKNHYQYDTLRRAKYSSMMVLYHLHNPSVPLVVTQCDVCHRDIEAGQGWRCDTCPAYDVCNACYLKDGGVDHPHKLDYNPSVSDNDAQSKEARPLRAIKAMEMLELIVHAFQCRVPQCNYPRCKGVKWLSHHTGQCRVHAYGGCEFCMKLLHLLKLHARTCKESHCNVPRCRDLKDGMKLQQQQSESRRRAAVMEMMRQRAKEVAGSPG